MFSELGKIFILIETRPKNEIEEFKFSSTPCGWRKKYEFYEANKDQFKLLFINAITYERKNGFSNNINPETRFMEFGRP
jgi:hypothetical protein